MRVPHFAFHAALKLQDQHHVHHESATLVDPTLADCSVQVVRSSCRSDRVAMIAVEPFEDRLAKVVAWVRLDVGM